MANLATAVSYPYRRSLAKVCIIVPTYNASEDWEQFRDGLSWQGISPSQVLIVDSSSTDDTRSLARREGYEVTCIAKSDFSHGATRHDACDYFPWAERLVFMTQDAVLAAPDALSTLCARLDNPEIGAAYGRQLPRDGADPIERHGRLFNYAPESYVYSFDDRKTLGFKVAFFSNSFAVYRKTALHAVGGFPVDAIVSEEVTVAARMLMAGWKIGYAADAAVYHSHPLKFRQEFSRYFDIGVHHGREKWLLDSFGRVGGEGRRYVTSELRHLMKYDPIWIPYSMARIASKFVAYHLGSRENLLPSRLKRALSAQPNFWDRSVMPRGADEEDEREKLVFGPRTEKP